MHGRRKVAALGAQQNRETGERRNIIGILNPSKRPSDVRRRTAACEVLKNVGSTRSKSFSARMRSKRTEPTMPRQPMMPIFVIARS